MCKEYWVNEYETNISKQRVFGARYGTRELAIKGVSSLDKLVGRWHVKLK